MNGNQKRNISSFSVLSLVVSVIAFFGLFGGPEILSLSEWGELVVIFSACLAIVSLILPPIAKSKRLHEKKQGKVLEILAIIVGGFDFYFVILALTEFPIIIGYFGWIICGVVYHSIKSNDNAPSVAATTDSSQSDNGAVEPAALETRRIAKDSITVNDLSSQKDNTDRNNPPLCDDFSSPVVEKQPSIQFCHKCGAKLHEGSVYCHMCGSKVWTAEE